MRKCFAIILCVIILLSFPSCTDGIKAITDDNRDGTGSTIKQIKNKKINFYTLKTESRDFFNQLFKNFQTETGITVEAEYNANSYHSLLATRTAANEMPDVFSVFPDRSAITGIQRLGTGGYLLDITDEPFVQKYLQSVNKQMELGGRIYSISCDIQVLPVIYNKKLFKQAGINKTPNNIDEWWEVCKKLKEAHIIPIASNAKDEGWFYEMTAIAPSVVFARDMDWQNKRDSGEVKWNSEPWIKVMSILKRMLDEGYFINKPLIRTYADSLSMFASSETAMLFIGNWEFENIRKMAGNGFEFGAFFFPGNEPGEKLVYPSSIGDLFTISAQTSHPEESKKLLEYFTRRNKDMRKAFGGYTTLKDDSNDDSSPILKELLPDYLKYKSYTFLNNKWPPDFSFYEVQRLVIAGEMSITDALKESDITFDTLYKKEIETYKNNDN